MKRLIPTIGFVTLVACSLVTTGCEDKSAAQKAMDSAGKNMERAGENVKKAGENVGEAVKKATEPK